MKEIWKDIPGFEGYHASNLGRIKSLKYGKEKFIGSVQIKKNGYVKTMVTLNGYGGAIGRFILIAFDRYPNEGEECDHIDRNPENNNLNNLEWNTVSENRYHAFRTGLQKAPMKMLGKKGSLCKFSIPVFQILPNGEKIKFDSATTAEEKIGVSRRGISQCARGIQEQAGGYKWQYN